MKIIWGSLILYLFGKKILFLWYNIEKVWIFFMLNVVLEKWWCKWILGIKRNFNINGLISGNVSIVNCINYNLFMIYYLKFLYKVENIVNRK